MNTSKPAILFIGFICLATVAGLAGGCGHAIKQFNPDAPLVTALYPVDGAQGVNIDTYISARFNQDIDTTSITNSSILVSSSSGYITGTVTYDSVSKSVIFYPTQLLSFATLYTVSLSNSIAGIDGSKMQDLVSWSFTTAAN